MIHALVADARTVRIFESPGRTINGASRQHQAYEPTLRAAVRSRLRAEPVYRPPPSRKRERRSTV